MRFVAAFAGALIVVFAMLIVGLKVAGRFPVGRVGPELEKVSVLSARERRDFAELLAPPKAPIPSALPELSDIPPLVLRHRRRGFVEAEVTVDRTGHVSDVKIVDATPPGVYEQQAIAELGARRYEPTIVHGTAIVSRHLEIVDFEVPEPDGTSP